MPKPLQYKEGSLIYCQGEDADKIYILQSGKVSLVYKDIETGDDTREQVQAGEFFGVKSALGRFPREENAIALEASTMMVFTVSEFETFVTSNTNIVMKMLRVFSSQMRRVHGQVSKRLETRDVRPDEGLFAIGEKHLKNKRYSHAKYVFERYLALYPAGNNAAKAETNLQLAESGLANSVPVRKR